MNKRLFAWSGGLFAYLFAVPFCANAMTIGELTESCAEPAEAILAKGFHEVTSDGFKERHIRVFSFNAPGPAAYFAVDINNTDETDAEIPRFRHICYQNIKTPPTISAKGDITLYSPANTAVPLRFRLDKTSNNRPFKHSHWKTSQTVWMRVVQCGARPIVLNPGEWPPGYPVANVTDPNVEITMQALPAGARVCYQYALHMDLADKVTKVDIGIDPQIINQPE
jgi:hypothetical protein